MGLEAEKYKSSFNCMRELVRAGGVRSLFFGVVPRAVRVFIEVCCKSMCALMNALGAAYMRLAWRFPLISRSVYLLKYEWIHGVVLPDVQSSYSYSSCSAF